MKMVWSNVILVVFLAPTLVEATMVNLSVTDGTRDGYASRWNTETYPYVDTTWTYAYIGNVNANDFYYCMVTKFTIDPVLSGKTIQSAQLQISGPISPYYRTAGCYLQLQHYTYNNDTAVMAADGRTTSVENIGAPHSTLASDWNTWDVTAAVAADVAAGYSHSAFRWKAVDADGNDVHTGGYCFSAYTSEQTDTSRHPKITVNYSANVTPDAGTANLTVTDGTRDGYASQWNTETYPYVDTTWAYAYIGNVNANDFYYCMVTKFTIDPVLSGKTIQSAQLQISGPISPYYRVAGCYLQLQHYTYNNDTAVMAADGRTTSVENIGAPHSTLASDWNTWDVTAAVAADVAAGYSHSAFRWKAVDADGNDVHTEGYCFSAYTSEAANPADRPVITVRYSWVPASVDRGHRILLEKGLQVEALAFPKLEDTGQEFGFSLSRFAESNFTTVNFWVNDQCQLYLGDPATAPLWSRRAGHGLLRPEELPYLSKMVRYQYHDEIDISDPDIQTMAADWFGSTRTRYPDVIVHTNEEGRAHTASVLQAYISACKPDMVMLDHYGFDGNLAGGSPKVMYECMQKYRQVALAGYDGTGRNPIPCALYTQTFSFADTGGHVVSESEMWLNTFSAWTFGYKYITAFTYTDPYSDTPPPDYHQLDSVLFNGKGDSSPTEKFYQQAEINRQSRNLGPALVRLLSTDVRMIMGRHGSGSGTPNAAPDGIMTGIDGADPYITGVTATNLGSKNNGLPGDVIIGFFKVLDESFDDNVYSNQQYFMVTNGLSDATGTAAETRQNIQITFNFGSTGITRLQRLSRDTGEVETVPLVWDGGSNYHLDLTLDGGTGDLFKYDTGAPFVSNAIYPTPTPGPPTPTPTPTPILIPGDANRDGVVSFEDFAALQNHYGQFVTGDAWSQGDFNNDGQVDFEDFAILQNHYGESQTGAAPAASDVLAAAPCSLVALALLILAGLAFVAVKNQE